MVVGMGVERIPTLPLRDVVAGTIWAGSWFIVAWRGLLGARVQEALREMVPASLRNGRGGSMRGAAVAQNSISTASLPTA
jgi:hypothetical protein